MDPLENKSPMAPDSLLPGLGRNRNQEVYQDQGHVCMYQAKGLDSSSVGTRMLFMFENIPTSFAAEWIHSSRDFRRSLLLNPSDR